MAAGANRSISRAAAVHRSKPVDRRGRFTEVAARIAMAAWAWLCELDERELERRVEAGDRKVFCKLMIGVALFTYGSLALFKLYVYIVGGLRFGWF